MTLFKNILFALCLLIMGSATLSSQNILTPPENQSEPTPFHAPKVSELNATLLEVLNDYFEGVYTYFKDETASLRDFLETADWTAKHLTSPESQSALLAFLFTFSIAIAIAFFIQSLLRRTLRSHIMASLEKEDPLGKSLRVTGALILYFLPIPVFGLISYTIFTVLTPASPAALEVATMMIKGWVVAWIYLAIGGFFLRPPSLKFHDSYAQIPYDPPEFNKIYTLFRRMICVGYFGYIILSLGDVITMPPAALHLVMQVSMVIMAVMAIRLLFVSRPLLRKSANVIRNDNRRSKLQRAFSIYYEYSSLLLVTFIVYHYLSLLSGEASLVKVTLEKIWISLSLIPAFHLFALVLKRVRIRFFRRNLCRFSPKIKQSLLLYGNQIDFFVTGFLFLCCAILILLVWGFNPAQLIFSEWGRLVLERSLSILIIVSVALFAIKSGERVLARYLIFDEKANINLHQKQNLARYETIHSVGRSILKVIIWVTAILLILAEFEINITPILATVGIFSVGLSFGVRSLVEDFVTGFFMFLENSFAVGDQLIVNNQMGILESLTVRILRVRAEDGSLHVFPYGKITSLSNQSREYSVAILMVETGYQADIDQVSEIIKATGDELRKAPATKSLVLAPLEINGVDQLSDHSITIKISIRTKPAHQFKVKRAFYKILKKNLDEAGIPLPIPQSISYVGKKENEKRMGGK